MWLYLYFIKRWLIKEAKINLDWYSLDFFVVTLKYDSPVFCILICFLVNFLTPQFYWPFLRLARQITECSPSVFLPSLLLTKSVHYRQNRAPEKYVKMLYLHQSTQAEICKCTVGDDLCCPILPFADMSVLLLCNGNKLSTIPVLFVQVNAMSTENIPQLVLFYSTYPLSSFYILYCSPCVVKKYILSQIYTGTDIKALTHEAQCNRLFLLYHNKRPWFILSLSTRIEENMKARATWVLSKNFTQVCIQK